MQIYNALRKQTVTRRRCPQLNKCVFSHRRNSRKVCSESRRWRGRMFHRRGPATVNERSPRLVRVLGTSHVATLDDRSRRRSAAEVSRQSSAKYYGDRPFSTLYAKTASLNSMRCRTGSQWSCLKTRVMCSRRRLRLASIFMLGYTQAWPGGYVYSPPQGGEKKLGGIIYRRKL